MAGWYRWVNQNQAYRHERAGGCLWWPKRKANGARHPFCDFKRVVTPGDVILSIVNGGIPAYGGARVAER
jgi:putative restriction endonuclease